MSIPRSGNHLHRVFAGVFVSALLIGRKDQWGQTSVLSVVGGWRLWLLEVVLLRNSCYVSCSDSTEQVRTTPHLTSLTEDWNLLRPFVVPLLLQTQREV